MKSKEDFWRQILWIRNTIGTIYQKNFTEKERKEKVILQTTAFFTESDMWTFLILRQVKFVQNNNFLNQWKLFAAIWHVLFLLSNFLSVWKRKEIMFLWNLLRKLFDKYSVKLLRRSLIEFSRLFQGEYWLFSILGLKRVHIRKNPFLKLSNVCLILTLIREI